MDLGAYAQINELKNLLVENKIVVPRLRGLRLMKDEEPMPPICSDEELERDALEEAISSGPYWCLNPIISVYGSNVDNGFKKYMKHGRILWDKIHGKKRKNLKYIIKRRRKRLNSTRDAFNKYAGKEGILYIHARIGGYNWNYYGGYDIKKEPWFLEKVDDCFDSTYCDIYAKINVDK